MDSHNYDRSALTIPAIRQIFVEWEERREHYGYLTQEFFAPDRRKAEQLVSLSWLAWVD